MAFRAGIAQLVERNLAKVEVGSSRLLSRSRIPGENGSSAQARFPLRIFSPPAGWQSGYAAACKAVYAGSIPTPASTENASHRLTVPVRLSQLSIGRAMRLASREI